MAIVEKLALGELRTDGCETRAEIRERAVEEYASVLREGGTLEPAVVFRDGNGTNWLASGHHRRAAHAAAGVPKMPCVIKQGGRWDAVEFGIRSNRQWKGERLSLEDKRFNVRRVLQEQPGMSDAAIASLVGSSNKMVAKYRGEMETTMELSVVSQRVGQDGRVYDTSNLGRKPAPIPRVPDEETPSKPLGESPIESAATSPAPEEEDGGFPRPVPVSVTSKRENGAKLCLEAHRRIGFASRAVDSLANAWPGVFHQRTMDALDKAGACLEAWAAWEATEHSPPADEQCPNLEGCEEPTSPG